MGCSEKMALECELRAKDVEELRTEVSHKLDRYDDLWLVHGALLEKAHKLRSEIIALRSGIRVECVGVQLGVENRSPKGPSFRFNGSGRQFGRLYDHAESSGS